MCKNEVIKVGLRSVLLVNTIPTCLRPMTVPFMSPLQKCILCNSIGPSLENYLEESWNLESGSWIVCLNFKLSNYNQRFANQNGGNWRILLHFTFLFSGERDRIRWFRFGGIYTRNISMKRHFRGKEYRRG